jgi:hypothetical protein
MADAEAVGSGVGQRQIVQIVAGFLEMVGESLVIRAAKPQEQFGAHGGDFDAAPGFGVKQALAGGAVICAEPSVGLNRCAIGMERIHVGGQGDGLVVPRVAVDAVEFGASPRARSVRRSASIKSIAARPSLLTGSECSRSSSRGTMPSPEPRWARTSLKSPGSERRQQRALTPSANGVPTRASKLVTVLITRTTLRF